ncbi:MAG: hypothetical protein Q8K58_15635 [Acidimicrobiales bacterium]|nr:hypothetical protein [Acidimicrobiales bacterium]
MIDDGVLRELASRQHGLVAVHQMHGLRREQRVRLVDGRRWERVLPRVVRLVGSPPTTAQRAMLGVLDGGSGAALSGASALSWWGVPGNLLDPLQTSRIRGHSQRPDRAATAHDPKLLPVHHVVTLEGVPTVVPARALFDLAGARRGGAKLPWWVDRIARMVDSAWALRLVSGASLHQMLDELAQRGRPGIRVMRHVLDVRPREYFPPASGLESRLVQLLERAGQPPLRRQVDAGDGHWIGRVDFRDPVVPLIIEVQSERFHASLIDRQLDAERVARLRRAGFTVVEVTDDEVWHQPQVAVQRIARARLALGATSLSHRRSNWSKKYSVLAVLLRPVAELGQPRWAMARSMISAMIFVSSKSFGV